MFRSLTAFSLTAFGVIGLCLALSLGCRKEPIADIPQGTSPQGTPPQTTPPQAETAAGEDAVNDEPDSANTGAATDPPAANDPNAADLAARLEARKAEFAKQAPAELRTLFAGGVQQVRDSRITETAKQVDDQAPHGELAGPDGETVEVETLWTEGPVVLLWYRGGWCPYCNLQLDAMQESLPQIEALGAKLVALTPELPTQAAATAAKHRLGYRVLSDPGNALARKFGLVYQLPPDVAEFYDENVKLSQYNGDDSNELPLSAAYVIDRDGKIRYAFLDADYTRRAEPSAILDALKAISL